MSDFLNQSKLKYDEPRYDEIYVFINHMLTIAKSNPDIQITRDMVYSELEKFTLPGKDFKSAGQTKKVNHLFQEWINYFENIQKYFYNSWLSPDIFPSYPHSPGYLPPLPGSNHNRRHPGSG